ncbi:MAG: hypothetical protein DRP60_01710 [Spirochaetes bacterium]|nr:MAG: hypothetical protein DRP60_01710 [Spirochaetota bacterium]
MIKLAPFFVKHRIYFAFGLLIIAGLSVPGMFHLNITVDIQDYFLADDPAIASQEAYNRIFPGGDFVGVLVQGQDVFSTESLELLRLLGIRLEEALPESGEAASLATISGSLTGGVKVVFDGGRLESSPEEVEVWRKAVSASPMLNGLFFSSDYKEAWVILPLSGAAAEADIFETGEKAWDALEGIDAGDMVITPAGIPIFAYRKQVELMADLIRVLLFGAVAAVLLSSVILRSFRGVIGTLSVFVFSVITVLGGQGWAGVSVDNAFMAVPILLIMGVSIGYAVHVHRFFHIGLVAGETRIQAAVSALEHTLRPIFYTAVTTVAALLSFLFVNIKPIRWVGYTSALGILTAFLFSVLFFPAILVIGKQTGRNEGFKRKKLTEAIFKRVRSILEIHEKAVLLVFLLVTAISVVGILKLRVDFDAIKMMGTRLPHMQDQLRISDSKIGVGEYMNLVIVLPDGDFKSADSIMLMAELENRLLEIDGITRVRSVTGVLAELNSLLHGRRPEYSNLPGNPVSLEALVRLLDGVLPGERQNWLDNSYTQARFLVEISDFSSRKIERIIAQSEEAAADVFPAGSSAQFSGSTYLVALMNQYITHGLIRSVATALIIISLIMVLVFRSLRWGLIAMIPNVFPVLIAGAVLGFAGIPLEFVTMTVAPIILGLAVDDTIHFMSFLKEDMSGHHDYELSLQRSFNAVGTAITETTLILCITFLVFLVSRINSIRYMGVIAAVGMAAAYFADLLITPILVRFLTRRRS